MSSSNPRTTFITGGAQGLGEAMARTFLAAGYRVALTDVRPTVRDTASRLDPAGAQTLALTLDVRDRAAFAAAFEEAAARFGGIDVMVNNAALSVARAIWDIDQKEWDDVMAVNLRGVFFGCQIAGGYMRERRRGRIINISSLAGQQGSLVNGAHYSASKAGILVLTKVFAQELASFGVTVNTIAPAAIRTPAMDAVPVEKVAQLEKSSPLGRLGTADEVASAALYLASDAASFVTGATIDVNGGRFMR